VKHGFIFSGAKVIKGFENIFIKLLARKKKVCIFALGLKRAVLPKKLIHDFKDTKQ
jgi:hypothetical protein